MIFPLVIIALGIFFFARALGLVHDDQFEIIWPLALVVLGLSLLCHKMFGHNCNDKSCEWCKNVKWNSKKKK
jgi:hypothetical protein